MDEAVFNCIHNSQRGAARAKTLLALVVFAALGFTAIKIVPSYVNNYELQDSMQQEARFNFHLNTGMAKSNDDIRGDIMKKVRDLGLPIKPDDIQVTQEGTKVSIAADYTIPVDLVVYQFSLHFHPQADNTSI
ncbi:MAG TPA: hypothetical protein VGR72_00925 [Candidatus Acidoferrales bacterium]|nr:hypothetical protein [Candidatus Acidoferrales bacterium]